MIRRLTIMIAALFGLVAAGGGVDALAGQTRDLDGGPSGQATDSLLLSDVLALAAARNPGLKATRARVGAAAAREPDASTLPDPILQFGVMNLAVPDFSDDMAMSMAPAIQLMQMVPFPGKLGLRGDIAAFSTDMEGERAEETWWSVRSRAADLFYDLYSFDRRIEVMETTLGLLQDFEQVARAQYEAGRGPQADVLRANVEIARIDGEIQSMEATRKVAAARLNALLDRPTRTPVPSPLLEPLPDAVPDPDTLTAWAERSRPLLRRGRLGVGQAQARVDLARKEIWPDVSVGFQYGQRDRGDGPERMGGVMLGVNLPVWAGRRQLRSRDEAEAAERSVQAELDGLRADVRARIGVVLAELERARSLIHLHRDEILPQARANVESAFSSYRVGTVDFTTLVDAELLVNRHEGELYRLISDYGKAVAELESALGRELPPTTERLVTEP